MSPDPLSIIWRLADVPDPVLSGDEIRCMSPAAFDCLTRLGLLRQDRSMRHVTCLDCADHHVEEVWQMKCPDGMPRFYIRCPENGRIDVSRERLLKWSVSYDPLSRALMEAFKTNGGIEEVVSGRLWSLGRAALAGISRTLWMARGLLWLDAPRLKEKLPRGKSPVLFFLGQAPAAGLLDLPQESLLDLKTVIKIDGDQLPVDTDAVESQLREGRPVQPAKKSPPKIRASRTALIDALKKELRKHLQAARDHAYATRNRKGEPELLPRPTQKHLAASLHTDVSNISRALNDRRDKEIKLYWDAANDLAQVMVFKK